MISTVGAGALDVGSITALVLLVLVALVVVTLVLVTLRPLAALPFPLVAARVGCISVSGSPPQSFLSCLMGHVSC